MPSDVTRQALDLAGSVIVVLDPTGRVEFLNREGRDLVGGELAGRDWFEHALPPADRPGARAAFDALLAGGNGRPSELEHGLLTPVGEVRELRWRASVVRDARGAPFRVLAAGDDVTEHRLVEDELAHLVAHDALTGLPNRGELRRHLDAAVTRARTSERSVGLLVIDLDDFSLVNDSLGPDAGDELLRRVAGRIAAALRPGEVVARHGGDEFLVLLPDLLGDGRAAAEHAARGIVAALLSPFRFDSAELHVGCSVGLAVLPGDAEDADTLLRHAHAALHHAKTTGGGLITAHHSTGTAQERLRRLSRLRRALSRDDALRVHWQPIVRLDDGTLEGLEALARWSDEELGAIPPAEFIPLAEEAGLIGPLGERVIEEVCRQVASWRQEGFEPRVALNVSPRELRRPGYPHRLAGRLHAHGLDPARLTVEVTEQSAFEDPSAGPLLEDLAGHGLAIALDDFGAGHSSLTRLRELGAKQLKIDRSFLREIPHDPSTAAIVTAILDFATALGMDAVAEGVETEEQRRFLLDRGCRLGQGFLLGPPVPADEVPRR